MSELKFDSIYLELKELIKDKKWELTSLLSQPEIEDEAYISLASEYLKTIDKIYSNLSFYKKNIVTLEKYILDFEDMSNNLEYKRVYDVKESVAENDSIRGINSFLKKSFNDFYDLDLKILLMEVSYKTISKEHLNFLQKKQFDLDYLVKDSKELIIHFKGVIDNYRNNVKMIPVFESSRIKIEENLNQYIDLKKSEMDRYTKSLKDEFNTINNKLKSFDVDFDRLKKSNSEIKVDNDSLQDKITTIKNDIVNFDRVYSDNQNKLESKMNDLTEVMKKEIYEAFRKKLEILVKELDEVDVLIKQEILSIKGTSKSFKDFISDETAIKLTDDYKNKAKWEMRAYYFFNFISLVIISFAIYFSYSSLSDFATKHTGNYTSLDLAYLGIRLIFSILIFSTIAFTSRLASKSYVYWKKNEGIFLRLTALKSFIADMSDSKKEEIHEKLVDVYFGKDEQEQNLNQKLNDLPNNITQLLGKVVDQTSVVLDASKPKKDTQPPASGQPGG